MLEGRTLIKPRPYTRYFVAYWVIIKECSSTVFGMVLNLVRECI